MTGGVTVTVGDPEGLTRFVAYVLLFVASFGASYYAAANARHSSFSVRLWQYVSLAAAIGSLFAAVAVAETIGIVPLLGFAGTIATGVRQLLQLFFVLFLAIAIRELYSEAPHRTRRGTVLSVRNLRRLERGFVAVVVVHFVLVVVPGFETIGALVYVLGGVAFTVYGLSFAYGVRSETMASGTVLDTMLTYTVAVLLTIGATGVIEGGAIVGVPAVTVQSAVNVLTVMGATFLIALVVRLKRNATAVRGTAS